MELDQYALLGTVFTDCDLLECATAILATKSLQQWLVVIDDDIPSFKLQAFAPRNMSIRYALEILAEAYMAELKIYESTKTVHFSYKQPGSELWINHHNPNNF